MNGVITASSGSNLIYSSGRMGCTYTFFALDSATGAVRIRQPLGDDPMFVDGGNNISLNDDRSLVFGSGRGIVRLRPLRQRQQGGKAPKLSIVGAAHPPDCGLSRFC